MSEVLDMKLSEESARLVSFISILNIDLPRLEPKHHAMLQDQYDHLVRWQTLIESTANSTRQTVKPQTNSLIDNPFVDPRILTQQNARATLCRCRFRKLEVRMHIEAEHVERSVEPLLGVLMAIICMFGEAKTVNILYVPSRLQKLLPTQGEVIGPDNINSGSTLAVGHGRIDVWRREEFAKIAVHELIHCLRCDIKRFPPRLLAKFYEAFHIDKKDCDPSYTQCRTSIFPNEAYVEAQANIFHTMYVTHRLISEKKDLFDLLDVERKWALYQVAKVLRHNGFASMSELLATSSADTISHACWRQNSNVFSYIVIRAAFLYDLGTFIDFLASGNSFMCFDKSAMSTDKRIELFTSLAIDLVMSKRFGDAVEKAMTTSSNDTFITQTLRMTALELQ